MTVLTIIAVAYLLFFVALVARTRRKLREAELSVAYAAGVTHGLALAVEEAAKAAPDVAKIDAAYHAAQVDAARKGRQ